MPLPLLTALAALHQLVPANLDDDPQLELVTCGHSGLLVLLDLR